VLAGEDAVVSSGERVAAAGEPPRPRGGSPIALGDSHNFGRRVTVRSRRVLKPRSLYWEQLLLSAESPLRTLLTGLAQSDGLGPNFFGFLPNLRFFPAASGVGGEVERLALEPLPRVTAARKQELAEVVGRSLALWSWLGAADLHWENLALGVDGEGQIVFGPLDIELLLADLSLPTETKLLPDADPEYAALCRHAAGVRRALPYLGKPLAARELVTLAAAYRKTLLLLERHAGAIGRLLAHLPGLRDAPIRLLLRSTGDYALAGSPELWPPLLDAEAEQLARGDVPYFFRFYGKTGIYYYTSPDLRELGRLPLRGDVPQLEPLLDLSRGLRSPSRVKLLQDGFFTVLGAFDHPSLTGQHRGESLELGFGARTLSVRFADGERLSTSRKLSAFVGSVYLPCRCGETRSVLVPSPTVCKMGRGA
jgi:hypothetical protein